MRITPPRFVLSAAAAAMLASCGGASGDIVLRSPSGGSASAKMTPTSLAGPGVNVALYGDELRGSAGGAPLSLRLDEARLTVAGLFGERPVHLEIRKDEGSLHVSGVLAGFISEFALGPASVEGTIGRCAYSLTRRGEGDAYEGRRSCSGRMPEAVTLQVPLGLQDLPAVRRAAFVSLMLAL